MIIIVIVSEEKQSIKRKRVRDKDINIMVRQNIEVKGFGVVDSII